MADKADKNTGGQGAPFSLPADLTTLSPEQLGELRARAEAEFDAIYQTEGGPQAGHLGRANELVEAIEKIGQRQTAIETEAAETQAKFDALAQRRNPQATEEETPAEDAPADPAAPVSPAAPAAPAEQSPAPQLVTATGGAHTAPRELGGLGGPRHQLNPSLSAIARQAPTAAPTPPLAITASVGLPGAFEAGARITDRTALGRLIEERARGMADAGGRGMRRRMDDPYGGVQVASIAHSFPDLLGENSGVDAVQAYIDKVRGMTSPDKFAAMVAGGGWCAPSENRYSFFNLACESGMIDLPTFGVTRGGINFPVSPSLADAYTPDLAPFEAAFSNATVPWLWTETDDILTVTGSTNKPCIRVPCSSMSNVRLECYGVCVTAGNLADNAWPESTANWLRLIMSAHYRASNARYISQIVTLAGASVTGCTPAGSGWTSPLLDTAEMGAIDYRSRYGMCDTDVIEWVFPYWALVGARADLAKRTGISDFMCVTDAMIGDWFSCRNIRAQFVSDWQVRATGYPGAATPITGLPLQVEGLMYAPGTVARGNGMSLNLGVVRDSTLNAENDHTALWMEECHLIAQFGHAVRRYQIALCPDGTTGAADLTTCCP